MHPSDCHHRLLYLFVCLFPDWAIKGLVLAICVLRYLLVSGQTHKETPLELGDMWPCGLAQPSFQQLATQHEASSSHQVTSAGGDSAQGLQVSSRALVQEGDRQQKAEVFCRPHCHRSYLHWLLPGLFRLLLPGEEIKKQWSQGLIQSSKPSLTCLLCGPSILPSSSA